MPPTRRFLDDLAAFVLDGAAVDWAEAERSASAGARPCVRQLQIVASVARVHRDVLATRPPMSQPAASAEHWGHLRLIERIGRGAFGEVFRAWDTRLDREVALKLLPAERAGDAHGQRAIQEGRLLARVRHANVVTIYGAEQIGDRIGLWMELVEGRTLEQWVRQEGPASAADVIAIGLDLCDALSAVHAAGLLHRDVKAHNVMRAEDGRVVLMDFGAGWDPDERSSASLAGTPLYLAPEVLAGGPATVQSDVYSLGVLLYHLATGSYPVQGRSMGDVRDRHVRGERMGIRRVSPSLRPALARAIERACDPRPERRYETVDALDRDLRALQRRPWVVRRPRALAAAAVMLFIGALAWDIGTRLTGAPAPPASRVFRPLAGAPSAADQQVIVVLPFENFGEPGRGLLVDRVTSDFIRHLGYFQGVTTVSQASSFMLRQRPRELAAMFLRLGGVDRVIEGDARFSGDQLRLRASLVSVADGMHLWNHEIEGPARSEVDVAEMVAGLMKNMVDRLGLTLRAPAHVRRWETDLVTSQLYWEACALSDGRGARAAGAIGLYRDVIRADSSNAAAVAALASTYGYLGVFYPDVDQAYIAPQEAAAEAEPLARQALVMDERLADAHAAIGFIHALNLRWREAEASFRRAIEIEPTLASLYSDFVLSTLVPSGQLDEGLRVLETALLNDPLSLDLRRTLARVQLHAGRYDEALDNSLRVLAEDPTSSFIEQFAAWARYFKGEQAEALDWFERYSVGRPGVMGWLYAIKGDRAQAEAIAALPQFARLPQRRAEIYGLLGDKDKALEALEELADINPLRAAFELERPEIGLKDDPRADGLRRRLRLPQ